MIDCQACSATSGSFGPASQKTNPNSPIRIGLALGGGFARGIAHAGVLKVLEERNIPIHCVAGVSAGSMAAAAFSSGASAAEIADDWFVDAVQGRGQVHHRPHGIGPH